MATQVPTPNIRIPINQFVDPVTGRPTQEWLLWLLNPQTLSYTSAFVTITGGTINGTTIGLTVPAAGQFTDLTALNGIGGGTF